MAGQLYKLRTAFTEFVRGEARSFGHDVEVRATSESDAIKDAIDRFDRLARESRTGWIRRPKLPARRDEPAASPDGRHPEPRTANH